jgi:hypothetical protein
VTGRIGGSPGSAARDDPAASAAAIKVKAKRKRTGPSLTKL